MFGWIADKWGRRTAFFAILFLEVIFSIATSFSPNYVIYTALRTVNGLSFPAIYQIPFILGRREREREIKKRKFELSSNRSNLFLSFFPPLFSFFFFAFSAGIDGAEIQNVRRDGDLHVLRVGDVSSGRAGNASSFYSSLRVCS